MVSSSHLDQLLSTSNTGNLNTQRKETPEKSGVSYLYIRKKMHYCINNIHMATTYKNRSHPALPSQTPGLPATGFVTGVNFLSATNAASGRIEVVYNNAPIALTTTAFTTGSFTNTAGTGLSSGNGRIIFDNAYHRTVAYIIVNDRTSFATTLLSGTNTTLTLSANGFEAWGPHQVRLRQLEYI